MKLMRDLLDTFGLVVELPEISEDCLYLNIYTPANRADNAKLPVRFPQEFGVVTLEVHSKGIT